MRNDKNTKGMKAGVLTPLDMCEKDNNSNRNFLIILTPDKFLESKLKRISGFSEKHTKNYIIVSRNSILI